MRKKRHAPLMSPHVNDSYRTGLSAQQACPACGLKDRQIQLMESQVSLLNEQIVFLRHQIEKLQDQLLTLIPQAADQYTRMVLSRNAAMSPDSISGIANPKALIGDEGLDVNELDELHQSVMKQYGVA